MLRDGKLPLKTFNIYDFDIPPEEEEAEGYHAPDYRFAKDIGASMMTARIYEMDPGKSNCPYHYEYGNEEWLILLEGELTIRTPGDEVQMRRGDVICFPEGPEGAHKITNSGTQKARFLFMSTDNEPAVAVYPDSDKIGVWPGDSRDRVIVERSSDVDYWLGET
jgi:uncharacterized cupin superfamily protein